MGKHWESCDVAQEFIAAKLESMSRGYDEHKSNAWAKYQTWAYKRKQLKQHFRKLCLGCGKNLSFTITQCHICGGQEFDRIPMRNYPENAPNGVSRTSNPADEGIAKLVATQFRAFVLPYCNGEYDLYLFDATLDGHTNLAELARGFGFTATHFQHRFKKFQKLYKYFNSGKEVPDEDKPTRFSKTAFIYRKGKDPIRVLTRLLVSGRSAYDNSDSARMVRQIHVKGAN